MFLRVLRGLTRSTTADINPQTQTITYKMPGMGRVMIRMGIQGSPLMNQLVDWKPRVKGMITEHWNGKDKDNLVDLHNHPKFKMIVTYFTLPENSVLAFGNKTQTYRDYKKSITAERPVKTKRFEGVQETTITVYSNDPDDPNIDLTIIGAIKRDVAVLPQGINFGDVQKDNYWTGFAARARVLVYNINLLKESDLPKLIFDLTKVQWKGKVALGYPVFGTTATHSRPLCNLGTEKNREVFERD